VSTIIDNLSAVKNHLEELSVQAGRSRDAVRLIVVSKTRSLDEVKLIADAGQRVFGENTVQDALTKIPFLKFPDIEWHFIGHLQSKKVKYIPENFQWLHTVDSIGLARKLSDAVINFKKDAGLNCLIQVNVTGEESKFGIMEKDVVPFMEEVLKQDLPGINWRGLMTMGVRNDEIRTRKAFATLRKLKEECSREFSLEYFDQLSMGMSGDYSIAIEEGATMVRIGSKIFGARDYKMTSMR
jgi:pyridoxal phosphate enzyme (YggS family)